MNCDHHVLNVHWTHHHWVRRVTATHGQLGQETDMWGRANEIEQVTCHIKQVCDTCGAVLDRGDCACDKSRGDRCACRLAYLESRS